MFEHVPSPELNPTALHQGLLQALQPYTAMRALVLLEAPPGICVWRLQLDLLHGQVSELVSDLPQSEREHCMHYVQKGDRLRYASARLMLRHALSLHLHRSPQALSIALDPQGKPRLTDVPALHFNLSHSGVHVLLALSLRGPLGVDIERVQVETSLRDIHAFLTADERTYCAMRTSQQAFFRVWCGKEAVLKALGVGITRHLRDVSALPSTRKRYVLGIHMPAPPVQLWQLPVPPGYVAALALSE